MPTQRTLVRRIQRRRVVAHIPNPFSTSVLNVPYNLKTTNRGEPFYAFDSGKEDPNRFIILTATQNLDGILRKMGSGWFFCRISFLILPAQYHAWNCQGHDGTIGVLSDEK